MRLQATALSGLGVLCGVSFAEGHRAHDSLIFIEVLRIYNTLYFPLLCHFHVFLIV
jgi:hypothetical protein